MLPIVLFILKLLGILLLVLLGVVLGAILLVLFVPVRYRIKGSYYSRPSGRVRITWLLHMVSVTAAYEDDFSVIIRLFGFRILKPVEESREDAEDMVVQAMEVTEEDAARASRDIIHGVEQEEKERIQQKTGDNSAEIKPQTSEKPIKPEETVKPKESAKPPLSRSRVRKIFDRIAAFAAKLKFSFSRICDKLKNIKDKKEEIQAWISNENNQKTVRLLLRQLKKLLRHLLPKKGRGEVVFGFEDPYMTGQVLTAAAVIYPFCHDKLDIYPAFDRQVFTAEGNFKGRVRIGTLLFIAVRMVFDKNFRLLLRKWLR